MNRKRSFEAALAELDRGGQTWGDLVEYVSAPKSGMRSIRYEGMFRAAGQLERILDLWAFKNTRSGKRRLLDWSLNYMSTVVSREGDRATHDGLLQSRKMTISEDFVLGFDLARIHAALRTLCPAMSTLMHRFSTTNRQKVGRDNAPEDAVENSVLVGTAMTDLLGERSQNNSYVKHIVGLYLYATGAQRQIISVLSNLGFCSSYPSIAGSRTTDVSTDAGQTDDDERCTGSSFPLLHRGAGLLRRISTACRRATRRCAHSSLCGHVYDNINMVFKIAEQILGRKDSQENGTCATIFPLYGAKPEDMLTSDLLQSFDAAPSLALKDILHSPEEARLFHSSLEHSILRIIVDSSESFARFRSAVSQCLPDKEDTIPLHQTEVHPLPAMNIDESSVTGNAEVMDSIFTELGFDVGTTKFTGIVRPVFGDQLSIARLRTLISNRAGHESLANSYGHLVFGPGFFHHQMALTHGIIETHWGDPQSGTRNPACLSFWNTILDRKPIVTSSLPPYRTCRDLIFTSLSGCIHHCLELVSGCSDLEEYARTVTFTQLKAHAAEILKKFGSPAEVAKLRRHRHAELARPSPNDCTPLPPQDAAASSASSREGDMVYENACLFLRDALVLREFTDAIKGGYSGRIVRVLKILALMYRGSGRTKYAHELLHLVHNLTHVWPEPLRRIMIKNWLVNSTGKANAWVPVDLLQEHMNYWIKVIYKAQGSNASWEWLQTISPCVTLLRTLASQVNKNLGVRLGSRHQSPELHRDIKTISEKLRMHNVYDIERGRVIEGEDEVLNVISAGLDQLRGPLQEYNRMFAQLQRRRRMTPLADMPMGEAPISATTSEQESSAHSDSEVGSHSGSQCDCQYSFIRQHYRPLRPGLAPLKVALKEAYTSASCPHHCTKRAMRSCGSTSTRMTMIHVSSSRRKRSCH
ncbi:hypothetical protein BV20DRAFT_957447 [Pilatotrama ljubarskyi]|nr:hypothetical protein BV20DRAFT_957447 [Pilatotrama ljubarskyi]